MGYVEDIYTYGICGGHIQGMPTQYTYGRDVYVWSIGVRYIYLISVILNVYGGYIYIYNFAHIFITFSIPNSQALRDMGVFGLQLTVACGLRFLVDLYGQLEECCNQQLLLGIVAFRLYLGSSWGLSRRGRREVVQICTITMSVRNQPKIHEANRRPKGRHPLFCFISFIGIYYPPYRHRYCTYRLQSLRPFHRPFMIASPQAVHFITLF